MSFPYYIEVYQSIPERMICPKLKLEPKTFIRLGYNHNYGKCFELVCWITTYTKNKKVITSIDAPYLSLLYVKEIDRCNTTEKVSIHIIVPQLREAIVRFKAENTNPMYRSYIIRGSVLCLDDLLEGYAIHQMTMKSIVTIQRWWREEIYYNPNKPACIARLEQDFVMMMTELKNIEKSN